VLRERARRGLFELIVIVSGVLIALAVDASWDLAKDRSAKVALVVALESDFDRNAVVVDSALARTGVQLAQARRVLDMLHGRVPMDPLEAAANLGSRSETPDVSMGAYLGALNSGQLVLLSPELNRELALIPDVLRDIRENSNLFLQLGYFGPYADVIHATGGYSPWFDFGPEWDEAVVLSGLDGPDALPGVETLYLVQLNRLRSLERLRDQVVRIRDLLASEVGDGPG